MLVDVSSSVVGELRDCREFYKGLLGHFPRGARTLIYTLPALDSGDPVGFVSWETEEELGELVEKVCVRGKELGTPLIKGMHELVRELRKLLKRGAGGIEELVLVSDLLSDKADLSIGGREFEELLGELVSGVGELNLRLKVVWIRRRPGPNESAEPFKQLLVKLVSQRTGDKPEVLQIYDAWALLHKAEISGVLRLYPAPGGAPLNLLVDEILRFIESR